MFCPKCGAEAKDGAAFCEKCGAPLSPSPTDSAEAAPAGAQAAGAVPAGSSNLGVAALVLSILGFLTGFLLIGMVLDVVAIVLAVLVFRKARKTPTRTGQALAAIIVAGLSLALCLLLFGPGLFSDPAGNLYKKAEGYYDEGSYTLAITTANEVLEEHPGTRAADKAEDLIEACEAALPGALVEDIQAALEAEDWDEAVSLCGELLEEYPDSPEAGQADGLMEQALAGQTAAEEEARFQESNEALLDAYEEEDWEAVLDNARTVINLKPDSPEAAAAAPMQQEAKEFYEAVMAASYAYEDWFRMRDNAAILTRYFPEDESAAEMYDTADDKIMELGAQAVSTFRTKYDQVQNITWYYPSSAPEYVNTRCTVYPYIGKYDSGRLYIRMKFNYTGDRWVFFDNIIVSIDGSNYTLPTGAGEHKRDNQGGDVWETLDMSVDESGTNYEQAIALMLPMIARSEQTIVRFQGDERQYDLTVSQADKDGILDILYGYEYLLRNG